MQTESDKSDNGQKSEPSKGRFWVSLFVAFVVGGLCCYCVIWFGLFSIPGPERKKPENSGDDTHLWGRFLKKPDLRFEHDGRLITLLNDFTYIDSAGHVWTVPTGETVNGASIPRPLWSIVGSPLTGKYRNASILHDFEYEKKRYSAPKVHRMFYEACRCGGLPENQSKLLYLAVYHYNPSWVLLKAEKMITINIYKKDGTADKVTIKRSAKIPKILAQGAPPELSSSFVSKLKTYVDENNPELEELEKLNLQGIAENE